MRFTRTLPIGERKWTDIGPEDYSPVAYPVSKQLSTLLRHGHLPREDDGTIEFWRLKDYLRNDFVHSQHWSDEMWKSTMARGGGNKKRFQYCTDSSGEILYLRAPQGHSGRNPIDPALQDNALIPNDFFEYIYHTGCAINLHSIVNSGLIAEGQNLSKKDRQYSLRLWVPWTRSTEIRKSLIWPNHVLHRTSRRCEKDTRIRCIGSIYSLLNEKDWCSIKQDVMQSSFTIHSQLIVSRMLLWWNLEKSYTSKYMCHFDHHRRFPSKIIEWKNWIQKSLEAAKTPNESNQNQKQINQNGETRRWTRIHQGDRERYLVWSRGRQALNKNGETRRWIRIHTKLRVNAYKNKRRSNKNGEIRKFGGARHWLQSTRIATCSCERSRTSPSSRACQKDRKSSASRSTSSLFAAE